MIGDWLWDHIVFADTVRVNRRRGLGRVAWGGSEVHEHSYLSSRNTLTKVNLDPEIVRPNPKKRPKYTIRYHRIRCSEQRQELLNDTCFSPWNITVVVGPTHDKNNLGCLPHEGRRNTGRLGAQPQALVAPAYRSAFG